MSAQPRAPLGAALALAAATTFSGPALAAGPGEIQDASPEHILHSNLEVRSLGPIYRSQFANTYSAILNFHAQNFQESNIGARQLIAPNGAGGVFGLYSDPEHDADGVLSASLFFVRENGLTIRIANSLPLNIDDIEGELTLYDFSFRGIPFLTSDAQASFCGPENGFTPEVLAPLGLEVTETVTFGSDENFALQFVQSENGIVSISAIDRTQEVGCMFERWRVVESQGGSSDEDQTTDPVEDRSFIDPNARTFDI